MKFLQILILGFLIVNFSCTKNNEVDPKSTWQAGCSSFYLFEGQYRYSNCCNLLIFQDLKISKGKTVTNEASLETFSSSNGTSKTTTTGKVTLSKDGKTLEISYSDAGGKTVHDSLKSEYSGPVCDCGCF